MGHVTTKDPFGFVGSHVIEIRRCSPGPRHPRRRRRRLDPAIAAAKAGAHEEQGGGEGEGEEEEEEVLHGWITRYDVRLDAYTLYRPGRSYRGRRAGDDNNEEGDARGEEEEEEEEEEEGEEDGGLTTVYARGDVMKFISNPVFQLRRDDDPRYPPPIEDPANRFVGAPMRRGPSPRPRRRRPGAADSGDGGEARAVDGRVVCFLPFADRYRVAYDDGATAEVGEREVIDGLLAFARRMREAAAFPPPVSSAGSARQRKRRRRPTGTASATEVTASATGGDEDDETEDEDLPGPVDRVKSELSAVSGEALVRAQAKDDDEQEEEDADDVKAEADAETADGASMATTAAESRIKAEAMSSAAAPVVAPASPQSAEDDGEAEPVVGCAMVDDDDDAEARDTPAVTTIEDSDEELREIEAVLAATPVRTLPSPSPSSSRPRTPPDDSPDVEIISLVDDDTPPGASSSLTPTTTSPTAPTEATAMPKTVSPRPVSYIVEEEPRPAIRPLDKRTAAFEVVRHELLRLLEGGASPEGMSSSSSSSSVLVDLLGNADVKDRDAVRRFVDTGGLVALNRELTTCMRDLVLPPDARHERLYGLLKLLAMLPAPSERQVVESSIGKTIGRVIKSRRTDQQADPTMPKCLPHLAKWVKAKWIASMQRNGSSGGVTSSSSAASANSRSRRAADAEPIPRRPGSSNHHHHHHRPPSASSSSLSSRTHPATAAAAPSIYHGRPTTPPTHRSSLKPDWMRQKESLSRTRFTINTDATAEYAHYRQQQLQRDRHNASTSSSTSPTAASRSSLAPSSSSTTAIRENDLPAGERGVFGRRQRLSFGPRWSVCEFDKDAPVTAVRRFASGAFAANPPAARHMHPKRSILRRQSKYRNELSFL